MEKRGQASKIILLSIVLIFLVGILFYLISQFRTSMETPSFSPNETLAFSCNNPQFQAMWEYSFKESYSNVIIKNISNCAFEAVKYTDISNYDMVFVISYFVVSTINRSVFNSYHYELNDYENNLTLNVTDYLNYSFSDYSGYLASQNRTFRNRTNLINNASAAISEASPYFNLNVSNISKWTCSSNSCSFSDAYSQSNYDGLTIYGNISREESQSSRNITISSQIQSCTPNWTSFSTPCQNNDRFITYYRDNNSCNDTSSMPSNSTTHCDSRGKGIIGNISAISSSFSLVLYINGTIANFSQNYSGIQSKIEFKAGNLTIIDFNWSFSSPLDLDNIYIEKQSSSASQAYLFIKGIPASKKVLVDKINFSSQLCVKNAEIISISSLSTNCSNSGEFILDCPGFNSGISCATNGSYYSVSGLTNSALREYVSSSSIVACTPNWNCTNWNPCINNMQIRICADRNYCGIISNRPTLNQSCNSTIPQSCLTNWACTNWTACANGNQTRTCTDRNYCGITSDKPVTKQSCKLKSANWAIITAIAVLSSAILAITIIIIILIIRPSNKPNRIRQPASQYGYVGYR